MMIDVNAYLGPFAFRRLRDNTAPTLLALMDRKGIDRAVVASAASITYRNAHAGNEEVAAEVAHHRDRLIPFAVLNPAYAGCLDDLKICHEQFGMRGVRLFPHWHKYELTSRPCLELIHAATGRGMLIQVPVRVEDPRQQSWLIDVPNVGSDEIAAVIRAAPKASFIISNGPAYSGSVLGRGNNGLPANYVIDISLMRAELDNEIGRLLASLGEDRIVFGTNMPLHYPDPALVKLELLEAPEAVKEKIRHGNAARLLGL